MILESMSLRATTKVRTGELEELNSSSEMKNMHHGREREQWKATSFNSRSRCPHHSYYHRLQESNSTLLPSLCNISALALIPIGGSSNDAIRRDRYFLVDDLVYRCREPLYIYHPSAHYTAPKPTMLRQAPPDERTLLQTLRTQETKRKSLVVELAVLNKEITEDYVGFQTPMESLVLELAVLSKEITETKVQYARLQRTMANERLPSLNIPIEVTAEIFREATFGLFDEDESTAREETLRALSHTCHTWRAIVLSLPELWAYFTSTTDRLSDLDRLSIYLSRSKNKPLDLYFYLYPAVKEEASGNVLQTAVIQAILKAAVGHISRWRRFVLRFVFEVETASWPNFIFEIITNQLFPSNLEVIVIDIDPTKDPSLLAFPPLLQDPVQPYFQDGAPRLLHATFDTWSLTAYKPLAHNVTTLHIRHPPNSIRRYPFTEFLDILASSRLVNLSLSGDAFHPPLWRPTYSHTSERQNWNCSFSSVLCWTTLGGSPGLICLSLRLFQPLYLLCDPLLHRL
ncbi:hypothetical protein CPB84DRAFT_583859 [Gymnopilus junonius]|uniref:F-box domain-containing protein n=1 Tax=Gymnopilus junonius TaxID=109634 RepID=A0A9P5N8B4_GYMJU|nr:hypothetical protein CPB84DRAFT_583859 [Gymnopilus junonius]